MILSVRYPHVRDFVLYYAEKLSEEKVKKILNTDLVSASDAEYFSKFIWLMIDRMARDKNDGVEVFGNIDNTLIIPDIAYEVDVLMAERGYGDIWEKVSDQA